MKSLLLWYPLRVTYSRELKVKEFLDAQGIENFIPMHYVERIMHGKVERKLVPVIHNLIFVRTDKEGIKYIKTATPYASYVRYIMHKATNKPIIIPEKQMMDFIAVAGKYDEQIMYLNPVEVSMKRGDKVRIKGGIWEGVEGEFVRIKRGLRVIVSIEGLMTVATASLHPSLVEKIG